MQLLFLVSGIGAAFSLRKRNGAQFIKERGNRLLLPLLIGTLLVGSIQSWLGDLSFGRFSGSFFAYFPLFLKGIFTGLRSSGYIPWGHLWFLAYLFVFSALALPLFLSIRRKGEGSRFFSIARRFASLPLILLPALWMGFLEALLRPGWIRTAALEQARQDIGDRPRPLLSTLHSPVRATHCSDIPPLEQWPIHLDQMDHCRGCVMEFCSVVYVPGEVRTTGQGLLQYTATCSQKAMYKKNLIAMFNTAPSGKRML